MVYFRHKNTPELFRHTSNSCKNSVSTYSSVQLPSHVTWCRITNLLKVCRVAESWYMSSRQDRKRNITVWGVTTDGPWRGQKILRQSAKRSQAVEMQTITEQVQKEKETEEKETTGWQARLQQASIVFWKYIQIYFLLSEKIFDHHPPGCYWVQKPGYCDWFTDWLIDWLIDLLRLYHWSYFHHWTPKPSDT